MMSQGTLLPVNVISTVPSPYPSADAAEIAICDDSHDYMAKPPRPDNPEHPAAEALGYYLAAACGLAVPIGTVLHLGGKPWAFGSRFEGGIDQFTRMPAQDKFDALKQCGPWLSALLALDLFMANDDRHADNALFRRSPIDNRWTFIAMDFSRALWRGNFPARTCTDVANSGNTSTLIHLLRSYNVWDRQRAGSVAISLQAITPQAISGQLSSMPPEWQTPNTQALATWWGSQDRMDRLNELTGLL